jgi:ribulose-phosphate 3-epimerase
VKISASIYSQKKTPLTAVVQQLKVHGVDMLHIDCEENAEAVFADIKAIRRIVDTPIDLHIISAKPWLYNSQVQDLQIEYVTWQYENMKRVPDLQPIEGTKFGLAIRSDTDIDILGRAGSYDYVMLMCTVPGMSGGTFQKENFKRIIDIKYRFPHLKIQIDGGVNDEIAYILRLLGVDSIVSGSFLLNHYTIGSGMLSFYKPPTGSNFQVRDFIVPTQYLPLLQERELTFEKVLHSIETYKQGFVVIVDQEGSLKGIISNADIRRGLLRQISSLNAINVLDMINSAPININEEASLGQMLTKINALNFIILFLPVVDNNGKLQGAVLLNNLTRG